MINYKLCSEVSDDQIFQAFDGGFSDYMVNITMEKDQMLEHFFGPEGNDKELSYIALDGNKGIGLILGGIRLMNGVKTMRCGTMCIHPEHRGMGIAGRLMDLHKKMGQACGCKQMFLEVIVGNDRAIALYKKIGYEKIYDLTYYNIQKDALTKMSILPIREDYKVKRAGYYDVLSYRKNLFDLHLPWQSDIEYFKTLEAQYYEAYDGESIVGACAIYKGHVFFLHVQPDYRGLGIGMALLAEAIKNDGFESVRMTLTNNAIMQSFCKHMGMEKNKLSQYEMFLT
ncbi:GNAT family N-acetyltransferase [Fusibacter sp. JL216-2]|uniref:GNAT family N-acetyltransferase n=1 Tax=Fusibacter sp. JL216-2 TaxID=3071453 RepID=UPI003D35256B